jgi:predicted metal-binding protein
LWARRFDIPSLMSDMRGRTQQNSDAILKKLCATAKDGGAEDVVVISTDEVIVDPRVRLKCMISPCYFSNTCRHCPPYGYSVDEVQSMVSTYEKAVFFRIAVDQELLLAPGITYSSRTFMLDDQGFTARLGLHLILGFQIVALVEKRARELGCEPYGFAAGDCRVALCYFNPVCSALKKKENCIHPNLSRPSMEAAGMNVYSMAANVGWDIYPVGGTCRPGDVPRGSLCGLVLAM